MGAAGTGGIEERLRRIEAITDVGLSELHPDAMLSELLERACQLLDVDTAAILVLDQHAQQLVATAARGIEEEVRSGFRLAVGRGFAGRVARDRRPVIIEEVHAGVVANPLLLEKGIKSLLGVPMIAGGKVVGVLHVGTLEPRQFSEADVHLLQVVADRAAMASQARVRDADRDAALALQRSLLPTRLPKVDGVDLAARYVPGHHSGVGGDWYDVFLLPSGWLGIVVGDVSGHGLQAAVVMGRLRSALRAYALECDDPAEVLTRLDRKIRHFEAGSLATAIYAMISPDRDEMWVSVAGHPPPVLAGPDRPADLLALPVDLPLGISAKGDRRYTRVELTDGVVVVCYTDGLVERRDQPIDAGFQRLRSAVRPGSAEAVCASIMLTVMADRPTDDVAVLTIQKRPST